jgi:hypothetical protein
MKPQSAKEIWTMPALLGVLSAVGLTVALVADGLGDAVSWIALGVPVAVGCWHAFRRGDRAA